MTVENCLRLAEHFRSIGNNEEADAYEARAKRKLERVNNKRYERYKSKDFDAVKTRLGVAKEDVVVEAPVKKK